MILHPDGRIVRFCLGKDGEPSSPLWRMWVQGDETYLALRTAIGVSKVSLHSTGHWALNAGTGRIPIKGPRRLSADWALGPRLVYPGIRPQTSLGRFKERTNKQFLLFEDPPDADWRDFAVLFGQPTAELESLRGFVPADCDLIGPLQHRCGASVWLATFIAQMTEDHKAYIRTERSKFQVSIRGEPEALHGAVAVFVQDAANGDTMLVNIELGLENVVRVGHESVGP